MARRPLASFSVFHRRLRSNGMSARVGSLCAANAEEISAGPDLIDTLELPLFPWQAGDKGRFIRIVPTTTSGRRFTIADPSVWQTPLSGVKRASME
jgi:hypothetical protein